MKYMKGITPIISIIVLLLITVSLAGAAYVFLSGYMQGLTGRAIQVTGTCQGGGTAFITVTNLGNRNIQIDPSCIGDNAITNQQSAVCGDITVVRKDSGSMVAGFDANAIPAATPTTMSAAHFTDSGCGAGNLCSYAFTRAGEWQPAEVTVQC